MAILIIVSNTGDWKLTIPGVDVVSARSYLTDPQYISLRNTRVFNLSRSYRYQSTGYYVSLLAAARGHKAIPGIAAIQDMKSPAVLRIVSDELEALIQKTLSDLKSRDYTLSIYFGRNLSPKYDKLSLQLFNLFQAPLLRAHFHHDGEMWHLKSIGPIAASEIPPDHHPYVQEFARDYFAGKRARAPKRETGGYDMAILVNPKETAAPSDQKAIEKFIRAAEKKGISAWTITRDDYARLAEYDALFIRETTAVNHHTFRFAQRAQAEGLAVVDDPESIIRCTNKVYLAELLAAHQIPAPRTVIVHKDNKKRVMQELGFPMVLKKPDSSFSQGVAKVADEQAYLQMVDEMFEKSDLLIAQEFMPTEFDWRVGIFHRQPLYVCKYFMAKKHWQIMNWETTEPKRYGKVETLPVELAPRGLIRTALSAANLIGDGLYGVDLKQVGNRFIVIEVNDNPSIEAGVEDEVLREKLYLTMMDIFLKKIRKTKEPPARQD